MTEHWQGEPKRLLLVVPIIEAGTPNGSVHTEVEAAAKAAEQLLEHPDVEKCRLDIIYKDRSSPWCCEVVPKEDRALVHVMRELVKRGDEDHRLMALR